MAAIAGIITHSGAESPEIQCLEMLRALEPYSSGDSALCTIDAAAFGRNLDFLLPEDSHDNQPFATADRQSLFVADARIDNREELVTELGISAPPPSSDPDLLFAAWRRWGLEVAGHVLGDYALASWDRQRNELVLLRSPFGYKPLFFALIGRGAAFASEPCALHDSGLVSKAANLEQAAAIIEQRWEGGPTSIFRGIDQVPHGHAAVIRDGRASMRRIWSPRRGAMRFQSVAEAGEALRNELDRAVRAQTRRAKGHLGSQLSAGRDSSAVSASAALALRNQPDPLLCFTGAPSGGFEPPGSRYHLADESRLAALTAQRYPNIRHFIERPRPGTALADMERLHATHHLPMLNPTNLPWWNAMERAAAERGVTVFLGAGGGNLTISLGGPEFLRDLAGEESVFTSLRLALRAAGARPRQAGVLLKAAFGPALSASQYRLIKRLLGREAEPGNGSDLLHSHHRTSTQPGPGGDSRDPRPPPSYLGFRRSWMMARDYPGKLSLAQWGFEHRDPTMDLRLVDLCHSLPARFLFGASHERPAYDSAFARRLPPQVRQFARRGLQGADWPVHFPREVVRSGFRKYARSLVVSELIDLEGVDRLTETWPNPDSHSVLAALSVASFLWVHFPG